MVIKAIKKAEVQGKGKLSDTRSPFTDLEYRHIMRIIKGMWVILVSAYFVQLFFDTSYLWEPEQMIHLSCQKLISNKCNTEPALEQLSIIITKLCWSKNIGIKV